MLEDKRYSSSDIRDGFDLAKFRLLDTLMCSIRIFESMHMNVEERAGLSLKFPNE